MHMQLKVKSWLGRTLSILKVVPCTVWGFPSGSVVKNLPAMQETRV